MNQTTETAASTTSSPGASLIRLCTHIFPDAHRCGSPALRNQPFCYFHHPTRRRVANPNERQARRVARQAFDLQLPDNRRQLIIALNQIVTRLAANQIDTRRAGLLLFAMQTVAQHFGEL